MLVDPRVEPWVSPVHCLEIAQCTESATRAELARTALELAAFRRILPAYEFMVVRAFVEWMHMVAPGAVRGRQYLDHHQEGSQRTMLCMLALMAMEQPLQDGPLDEILKGKFGTQRLHAEAVSDPSKWIGNLLDCADKLLLASQASGEDLDAQTVQELQQAVRDADVGPGISKKLRDILNKRRRGIARAYGAVEIGACIVTSLTLPLDVNYTFDVDAIQEKWSNLHAGAGTKSVPPPDVSHGVWTLLAQLTYALARGKGLLPATLANETVIREVERFAAKRERPNAGALFDGDHAVYLTHAKVFVSDDDDLRSAARPLSDLVSQETGGLWAPEVVTSKQAVSTLRRLLA